jgi:hypothetical protein
MGGLAGLISGFFNIIGQIRPLADGVLNVGTPTNS